MTAAELREAGNRERDRANWPAAAFYYSRLLATQTKDSRLHLQIGHTLKESGLLHEAADKYRSALALSPADPEPHVQLAIVMKMVSDFDAAIRHYAEAARLGYQPAAFIEQELGFLRKTADRRAVRSTADVMFYLSAPTSLPSEMNAGQLKTFLGAANYSYAYAMNGFRRALQQAGHACEVIRNPEYLPDIRANSASSVIVHLAFYPPDGPRYLKGAHNIVCLAWEFERLPTFAEKTSYQALVDPVTMLRRADGVWTTSAYGAEALRGSGVPNVSVVPTPVLPTGLAERAARPRLDQLQVLATSLDRIRWVPLGVWPNMQSTLSQAAESRATSLLNLLLDIDDDDPPSFFVSVFNVHDFRKQIKPLVEAFVRFARDRPNAFLLLKVSCIDSDRLDINTMMFMDQISEAGEMTAPLVSNNILMTTDALLREEMNMLYDIASFYVCTSHAEGQNLPMVEAMGRGIVPISVDTTAMGDYISGDNAVVIPSRLRPFTPRLTLRYGLFDTQTYFVQGADVFAALDQAARMGDAEYAGKSNHAIQAVSQHYGQPAFSDAINTLLEKLKPAATMVAAPHA